MSLLTTDLEITEDTETTKTYKLSDDKIQGSTDNLEALQQAVNKILNTEKYEYPIYSFSYGIDVESLIGKDPAYVKIEFKRRITECLFQDERITSVDNFVFTVTGDEMLCAFDVVSVYGETTITKEVNV
jgi:hypothetical protein